MRNVIAAITMLVLAFAAVGAAVAGVPARHPATSSPPAGQETSPRPVARSGQLVVVPPSAGSALTSPPGSPTPSVSAISSPSPAPMRTLLRVSDHGWRTTPSFTVRGGQTALAYAYDCSGSQGPFDIYIQRPTTGSMPDLAVSDAGSSGSATTWWTLAPGAWQLSVQTGCHWSVTVSER